MANTDRARKLMVRSALATSATIATFVGAQNLAMLDMRQFVLDPALTSEAVTAAPVAATPTLVSPTPVPTVAAVAPTLVIRHAAPSILILRPGAGRQVSTVAIQPTEPTPMMPPSALLVAPQPVVVAPAPAINPPEAVISAPAPVVVEQPVQERSRSTR